MTDMDLHHITHGRLVAKHPGDTTERVWSADADCWLQPGDMIFETSEIAMLRLMKDMPRPITEENFKRLDAVAPVRYRLNVREL